MKNIFLVLFVLITHTIYAQKNYYFDTALEYKFSHNDKEYLHSYLINSKDNNYLLFIKDNDTLNYELQFKDRNILSFNTKVKKDDLAKAESILINCGDVKQNNNPFKYKVNEYEFLNLTDTIINSTEYYHYVIRSNKSAQYQKRKKIAKYHYIVRKNTPEFLPFFTEDTPYEEWLKEKKTPNGLVYMIFKETSLGKISTYLTLNKTIQISKNIIIPLECDYSIDKNRIENKVKIISN